MRRMSFSLTTAQVRSRSKIVTRRKGWANLAPGEHLLAIEKGMGLKKGERHVVLDEIVVVDVRREPLSLISREPHGCGLEGFPDMTWVEFVELYCRANGGGPAWQLCTRIQFRYAATSERQWEGWPGDEREPLTDITGCDV